MYLWCSQCFYYPSQVTWSHFRSNSKTSSRSPKNSSPLAQLAASESLVRRKEIYWDLTCVFLLGGGAGEFWVCQVITDSTDLHPLPESIAEDRDTQSEIILWDLTSQGSTQHVSVKKTWPPRHEEDHSDLCQRQPSLANNPCCIVSVKISGETWNLDSDVGSSSYIGCIISSYTVYIYSII